MEELDKYQSSYYYFGVICEETSFFKKNTLLLHNPNNQSAYTLTGQGIYIERWELDGKLHRIGGPAVTISNIYLPLNIEYYYRRGKVHNAEGPAIFYKDTKEAYYFLKGEGLPKNEWKAQRKLL